MESFLKAEIALFTIGLFSGIIPDADGPLPNICGELGELVDETEMPSQVCGWLALSQ